MTAVLVVAAGIFGVCIGSFTNVIIDRLPVALDEPDRFGSMIGTRPWGEVLGGRSRCSSCQADISATDLIPVVSWLRLRGKCRECGESIPAFHPLVEAGLGATAAFAAWRLGWVGELAIVGAFIPVAWALAIIDWRTLVVPKAVIWPATGVIVAVTVALAIVRADVDPVVRGAVGALAISGPLFLAWFVKEGGMGFGDVRLAVFVGWAVGATASGSGWLNGLFLAVVCLAMGAVLGVVIGVPLVMAGGRATKLPFGPPLLIAAYICLVFSPFFGV